MQGCNSERPEDANSRESGEAEISPTFFKDSCRLATSYKIHETRGETCGTVIRTEFHRQNVQMGIQKSH